MNKSSRSRVERFVLVAVIGDLDAAHQFHDEVGPARFRRAGVQHLGDVRMVHQRQRLPLGLEPGDDALGVHAQLDDLERDAAADRFLLLGHINHAAAAFADLLEQFVAANPVAGFFGQRNGSSGCPPQRGSGGDFQESARLLGGIEQRFDAPAQRASSVAAGLIEIGRAVCRRQLPRRGKDDFFWIRLVHGWFWNGLLSHKAKTDKKKAHGLRIWPFYYFLCASGYPARTSDYPRRCSGFRERSTGYGAQASGYPLRPSGYILR